MANFGDIQLNPGTGGSYMPTDSITNASTGHTDIVVFSGLAFGALGGGAYQTVDLTHGLPVQNVSPLPAGTNVIGHVIVDSVGGTVAITAASLPLPTGAATDATVTAMSAKLPATLGQHAMAASVSVVIASDQGNLPVAVQGTVPVSGTFWQATQPVSGTVAISAGAAVIGHVIVDSGTITIGNATLAVTQSGTWTVQQGGAPWSTVGNVASGVADSGAPLKTGGVFNTTQPTVTTGQRVDSQATARGGLIVATGVDAFHATIDNASIAVTQSGTWSLGASSAVIGHVVVDSGAVTVSGTVTGNQGTAAALASAWPVKVTDGTNTMPTGDAAARSIHTTLDNASIAVTGTFWQGTQPVSLASLPALATGTNNAGYVTPAPAGQTTGATPFVAISAANTTPIQIKGTGGTSSAGTIWNFIAMQVGTTAPLYAKFFDKAASPTMGTDTPVYVLPLPTAGNANGAGAAQSFPTGLKFANGIWVAFTTGIALLDNTAGAASQAILSGSYN